MDLRIIFLIIVLWIILLLGSFFESATKKKINVCGWILLGVGLLLSQFLDVATTYIALHIGSGLIEESNIFLRPLVYEGNIYTLMAVKILMLILFGFVIKFFYKDSGKIFVFGWIVNIIFCLIGIYNLALVVYFLKIL